MRRIFFVFAALLFSASFTTQLARAYDWPKFRAPWVLHLMRVEGLTEGFEEDDPQWIHLHQHEGMAEALSATVIAKVERGRSDAGDPAAAVNQVRLRYTIHGVPVSGWLNNRNENFEYELRIDNPEIDKLPDGVHDLSVEIENFANKKDFRPFRAFVHLMRGREESPLVPIINADDLDDQYMDGFGPGVHYVDCHDRDYKGYPLNPEVEAWSTPPQNTDLYMEVMSPKTDLFVGAQMWWAHSGMECSFIRGLEPKLGEDHRSLRVSEHHDALPFKDGPRGVGWMSTYVSGQVTSEGIFAFAETGGRIGMLKPDGEIVTVAGWRVQPGKDPNWFLKPLERVRQNMELRGNWVNGQYTDGNPGFRTPLDVTVDPDNEWIWYVAGYEDNVIWKLEVDPETEEAEVSVFAGALNHASGLKDGRGTDALFHGPSSLTFDAVRDVIYVADQENDAIRQIARDGKVTTLFGGVDMGALLRGRGLDIYNQLTSRLNSQFEVSWAQAAIGKKPDIYKPQTIEVDSEGNIILLELGYGAIRRINPETGETKKLGEVRQKFKEFDRGWAWLDVDRAGNAGPKDGIYWARFVGADVYDIDGNPLNGPYNEIYAWLPKEGGTSQIAFRSIRFTDPLGWGQRESANMPHYPWLVAVDPRGAVLVAGGGEHGISRFRKRRADDPLPTADYGAGKYIWWTGATEDGRLQENSPALKFGMDGHNYLGLTDAWGLKDASDAELLAAFEIPDSMLEDEETKQALLDHLRPNTLGATKVVDYNDADYSSGGGHHHGQITDPDTSSDANGGGGGCNLLPHQSINFSWLVFLALAWLPIQRKGL